jgi:nucleoid-associated protein YgaU
MSVMSAAEARQGDGASPEIPPRRLQIATPAAGQDDAEAAAGSPLPGVGQPVPSAQPVTEPSLSALRVTRVRVVREVSVRTLRAGRTGPVPGRPGPVRLTRRGRRVVAGFVLGVIIVAVTVLWMSAAGSVQASSHAAAPGSAYRGMTQVVVQPGQTLWSIAAAAEPSGNLWAVVQQIINVNALSGAQIQTGQLLWVPKN